MKKEKRFCDRYLGSSSDDLESSSDDLLADGKRRFGDRANSYAALTGFEVMPSLDMHKPQKYN